jgi:hypothetical protein
MLESLPKLELVLAYTISPMEYDEKPVPPICTGTTPLTSDMFIVAHDGAERPFALKKPLDTVANIAVAPTADWYGIEPTLPPAKFVAVVAVVADVAVVAEPADVAVVAEPADVAYVAVAALPVVLWFSVGKSAATAIEGSPVLVVFLRIPVAKPARETLLIFVTLSTPAVSVTSPVCVTFVTLAVLAVISLDNAVLSIDFSTTDQEGAAAPLDFNTAPLAPDVSIAVLLLAVWYGTAPVAPPAMLVAVVASVAVAALPVVDWFSVGKSAATAIDGAPVLVVFLRMPVARPAIEMPLILPTVRTPDASVTSPVWVAFETLAVLVTCWSKIAGLIRPLAVAVAVGITSLPPVMWVLAWLDGTETPASEMVKM